MRQTIIGIAVLAVTTLPDGAAQQPDLAAVLVAAGKYVAQYEAAVSLIVAEELYVQQAQSVDGTRVRRLRSDLAVLVHELYGWVGFRDVYEVDGKPVRDRVDRVLALFEKPNPNTLEQARRIAAESARFNLHPAGLELTRTINVPLTPMRFFRAVDQRRSTFELDGTRRTGGRTIAIVKFRERSKPRMILSSDEAPALGTAWIDVSSGRIERTELKFDTATRAHRVSSTVFVSYAEVPRIGLWMPVTMDEDYDVRTGPTASGVTGRATYSNFRQFKVDTSVIRK